MKNKSRIEELNKELNSYYDKVKKIKTEIRELKLEDYNFENKYIFMPRYGYMHVSWQKYENNSIYGDERMFFQGLSFYGEYTPYSDANQFEYNALSDWYIPVQTFEEEKDNIKVLSKSEFIEKFKEYSSKLDENFMKQL